MMMVCEIHTIYTVKGGRYDLQRERLNNMSGIKGLNLKRIDGVTESDGAI